MKYHELVAAIKEKYEPVDADFIGEHVSCQFNVTGEAEGAFYIDIYEGKAHVMPYEYFDRDVLFFLPTDVMIEVAFGRTDLISAIGDGWIGLEGRPDKVRKLKEFIDRVCAQEKTTEANAPGDAGVEKNEATEDKPAASGAEEAVETDSKEKAAAENKPAASGEQETVETDSKEKAAAEDKPAASGEQETVETDSKEKAAAEDKSAVSGAQNGTSKIPPRMTKTVSPAQKRAAAAAKKSKKKKRGMKKK